MAENAKTAPADAPKAATVTNGYDRAKSRIKDGITCDCRMVGVGATAEQAALASTEASRRAAGSAERHRYEAEQNPPSADSSASWVIDPGDDVSPRERENTIVRCPEPSFGSCEMDMSVNRLLLPMEHTIVMAKSEDWNTKNNSNGESTSATEHPRHSHYVTLPLNRLDR